MGVALKVRAVPIIICLVFSKEVVTFSLSTLEFVSMENLAGKTQEPEEWIDAGVKFICRYGHQGGVCCFGLGYKLLRLCTL